MSSLETLVLVSHASSALSGLPPGGLLLPKAAPPPHLTPPEGQGGGWEGTGPCLSWHQVLLSSLEALSCWTSEHSYFEVKPGKALETVMGACAGSWGHKLHADSPGLIYFMIWTNFSAVIDTTHHLWTSQKRPAGEGGGTSRNARGRQAPGPICHGRLHNSCRRPPQISGTIGSNGRSKRPSFITGRSLLHDRIAEWVDVWRPS